MPNRRRTRAGSSGLRPRRALLIAGMSIVIAALTAPSALAQADDPSDDNDLVVLTGHLDVAAEETVDVAVIFDGPARVEGTVRESLVVFNGDTEIVGTVEQDVIVFNGDVVVRSGAEVGGDLVTQGEPQVEEGATVRGQRSNVVTRFDFDEVGFAGRFAWWIAYSISVLILGVLLLAFAPHLAAAIRDVARDRMGSSIGWGVALFFLLPIGSIVLLVTVVGIPLGIFTLLALALIYTLGYVVATVAVGGMIMRSSPSRFVVFLVGLAVLRLLALIPVVGGLLWFVASVWGLGLLAVAIRSRPTTDAIPPVVPPVPPSPIPAA